MIFPRSSCSFHTRGAYPCIGKASATVRHKAGSYLTLLLPDSSIMTWSGAFSTLGNLLFFSLHAAPVSRV